MLDLDYSIPVATFPVVPDNSLVFGLPNDKGEPTGIQQWRLIQRLGIIGTLQYHSEYFCYCDTPIDIREEGDNIYFVHKSRKLVSPDMKFIDRMDFDDRFGTIITGGYYFDGNGWGLVKTFLDEGCMIDETNNKYSFDNCYMIVVDKCVGVSKWLCNMVPLNSVPMKGFNYKYSLMMEVIDNMVMPLTEVRECCCELKRAPFEFVIIKFSDRQIKFPNYLRPLLGDSPLFHTEGFGESDYHRDMNGEEFEVLLGWLFVLVLFKEFPTIDVMIEKELNIIEWYNISDYFNIPVFIDLFGKLKSVGE